MINVCVPVLRRYDLLRGMMLSLRRSAVVPGRVVIIDNGQNEEQLQAAIKQTIDPRVTALEIFSPKQPLGVAASWNWFLRHVREERIITNDDIEFGTRSLEKLTNHSYDLAWAAGCGFACFHIRDSCVKKLGYFDEDISPGYGYYEDEDYLQRLDGRGTREPSALATTIDAGVFHFRSATLQAASHHELLEHHRKFKIAQGNYARKWGLEAEFE